MIISASYDEISRLVREKSGQSVGFQYKSADTLTVSYEASISLPVIKRPVTHTVSADVRLVGFDGRRAVLQIDAGGAGNMALDMASRKLLQRLPEGLVESFSGGRAVLNMLSVPKLGQFFERMQVNSLSFCSTSLILDVSPV